MSCITTIAIFFVDRIFLGNQRSPSFTIAYEIVNIVTKVTTFKDIFNVTAYGGDS